ncbi:Cellobiose 2-epimerase [compost metagenome]
MKRTAAQRIEESRQWLTNYVFPLWREKGIDSTTGSFAESISFEGAAMYSSQRALVQARQIYSFTEASRMGLLDKTTVKPIVAKAIDFFISKYSLPSGAFVHAVNPQGEIQNKDTDLYTQAFALFALANAYEVLGDSKLVDRARQLVNYLNRDRKAKNGGYTEIKNDVVMFQSNPHMHLFESALAWMKVDSGSEWKELAQHLHDLCHSKFIDRTSGALCEHFAEGWTPLRENGNFIFEPGHHYEWAWLMLEFQELTGSDEKAVANSLFKLAEEYGVNNSHMVIDEVWSDFTAKKRSSRFWPQSERIKAAVSLGLQSPAETQAVYARAADEAMDALAKYFEVPTKGLWQDTLSETGHFVAQPAKASSLYHIINALSEYGLKRPGISA